MAMSLKLLAFSRNGWLIDLPARDAAPEDLLAGVLL